MKLNYKLPLAFAGALAALLLASLFGIHMLSRSLDAFEHEVLYTVDSHKRVAQVGVHFATAIQEWKNVLVRGKEGEARDKYWTAHLKAMDRARTEMADLRKQLQSPASVELAERLSQGLEGAAGAYRQAYEAFNASGQDPRAGDQVAKGKDRAAAEGLENLKAMLSTAEVETVERVQKTAAQSLNLAYTAMAVMVLASLAGSLWISRRIVTSLQGAVSLADQVAQGNLTNRVETQGKDEVADLVRALDTMQKNLSQLVSQVRTGSESVSHASNEIAHGNHDLSSRTEQQASALEQTAASMQELASTVRRNAEHANDATKLADHAAAVAARGGAVVDEVVHTMGGINESSRKIADIIGVIDNIAFQTNILALNAAVEASRAGEHGRGFAVVASEVRTLAGRSAEAAREIKQLIQASVERVGLGSTQVAKAGETMKDVVGAIQRVNAVIVDISQASSGQASSMQQIDEAVRHIDNMTQQNSALVEEMAAAASALEQQSRELVHSAAVFRT